jgi:hypothetical protein
MTAKRPARRLPVILYRVLEVAVMVVTYLILALILFKAIAWIF